MAIPFPAPKPAGPAVSPVTPGNPMIVSAGRNPMPYGLGALSMPRPKPATPMPPQQPQGMPMTPPGSDQQNNPFSQFFAPSDASFAEKLSSPAATLGLSLIANSGPSLTPTNPLASVGQDMYRAQQMKLLQEDRQREQAAAAQGAAALNKTAKYYSDLYGDDYDTVKNIFEAGQGKAYLESKKTDGQTDTMRNLQWRADQAGLQPGTPEYAEFFRTGGKEGMSITVGGTPELGKLSTDFAYLTDPETRQPIIDPNTNLPRAAPIPGSPAASSVNDAREKEALKAGQAAVATRVVTTAAQRARNAAKERDFGPYGQGIAKYVPWTDSAEVSRQVEVLKSTAKVENLNAMRAASPTGGALGSVTEKEGQMLADKSGALDPSSPTFERDLDDYELTLLQIVHGPQQGQAIFNASRGGSSTTENDDVDALIERYGGM